MNMNKTFLSKLKLFFFASAICMCIIVLSYHGHADKPTDAEKEAFRENEALCFEKESGFAQWCGSYVYR